MKKHTPTKRRRKAAPSTPAAMLDRLADMHLQQGFRAAAERLAWCTDALREMAQ